MNNLLSLAILIVLGAVVPTNAMPTDDVDAAAFLAYVNTWNKTYDADSRPKAFMAFKASLRAIEEGNRLEGAEVYGLTKFSDIPADEFRARFLTYKPSNETTQGIPVLDASDEEISATPQSIDWRSKGKVTPVKASFSRHKLEVA